MILMDPLLGFDSHLSIIKIYIKNNLLAYAFMQNYILSPPLLHYIYISPETNENGF